MSPKLAKKRYFRVVIPSMICFLVSLFIATWVIKSSDVSMTLQVLLTLIPAACICWFIWGHGRFLFEVDEYQREQDLRAILYGVGATLAFCTSWGLLEMLADVPKFPVYYTFVVFCAAYSIAKMVIARRIVCV